MSAQDFLEMADKYFGGQLMRKYIWYYMSDEETCTSVIVEARDVEEARAIAYEDGLTPDSNVFSEEPDHVSDSDCIVIEFGPADKT